MSHDLTLAMRTKIDSIQYGATANDTDSNLKSRTNHTGTQSADTTTDGSANKVYTSAEKTKLAGIATAATTNDTDANLKNRANHTGTQLSSTISDFNEAAQDAIGAAINTEVVYSDAGNSFSLRARAFTNNASRSLVSVAAAANGFQVSSTRDSLVSYSVNVSTTSTIASGATGVIALEIASTNSTTAGDWQEVGRFSQGQTLGLAVALQITQPMSGQITAIIPDGYYARLRSINTTGTLTYAYNSGQEVLL